jgi:predicted small secreted protein
MKRVFSALCTVAVLAFFMAGCSTTRLVDSDVTAFSRWSAAPPAPGTPYRFERLPSQQTFAAQQDQLEALARNALARVGLDLNPTIARYSVQVVVNTLVLDRGFYGAPGYGGFGYPMTGVFLGGGNRGASLGLGMSFPLRFPDPYFKRELSLLMRELSTGQVVFETRAVHDGVWSDTLAVLPAMLDAALTGFPQPPPGTRRVNVEIPR